MNSIEFKRLLFNPKSDKGSLFGQLKRDSTYNSFFKIIEGSISHPLTKSLLLSGSLPTNYSLIRQGRPVAHSGNLIGELAWHIYAIKYHSEKLNEFIKRKVEFDKFMLLNRYEEAEAVLDWIELNICKSTWSIENRFLLLEYKEGVEANWTRLSDFVKEVHDPLLLYIAENLSKRAENKISYFRFRNLLANQINDIEGPNEFREYLCFKLNYPAYHGFENFSFFLALESISPVIDRYLLVRDTLVEIVGAQNQEQIAAIAPVLTDISSTIADPILQQLELAVNPTHLHNLTANADILELLDLYTRGNYDECIKRIPFILQDVPMSVESYEIYAKALLELRMPFRATGISPLVDQILGCLYDIFSRSDGTDQATEKLLKVISSFYSTGWAKQLFTIVSVHGNFSKESLVYDFLFLAYSNCHNPRLLNHIVNQETKAKLKDFFEHAYSANMAFIVNDLISNSNLEGLEHNGNISLKRKQLYKGRILRQLERYADACVHYEALIGQPNLSVTAYEEIIQCLFDSYLRQGSLHEAAVLLVSHFLKNQYLVSKLKKDELLSQLEKVGYKDHEKAIDFSIFFNLATNDPYKQYVAYDIFLSAHNVERPSQLFDRASNFPPEKFLYFLREVCTPQILQYSYVFEGSDDIDNERLLVLRELLLLDKDNENIYIRSITEISQNSIIRKAIREVNKGRITVNVQQLKTIEANNVKEGFSRYQELSHYAKSKELLAVDTSSKMINEYLNSINEEKIKSKIVYTNDPAFITFKVMFLEIRDKFILSTEYGLDGYLSTRIRHGTLLNHLRSVFESLNLISQKDGSGKYQINEYWLDKIPYALIDKRDAIQNSIKAFSKKIDDYTEFIIKELIQIKTEKYQKKPNALFDYSVSQVELANIFASVRESINDYETFLEFVFQYLETKTKILLSKVRDEFNQAIKDHYNNLISDFQIEVRTLVGDSAFVDLTSSIAKCSTYIQNELRNVSEWFHISDPTTNLTLDLKSIIHTSLEITNSIFPNNKIKPKRINIGFDYPIVGALNLIYIVKILLDNIIIHSGLTGDEKQVEISSESNEESLTLIFSNAISSTINLNDMILKLEAVKNRWTTNPDDFDRLTTEGGSGFDKIRKILAYDMSRKNFQFDYTIADQQLTISIQFNVKIQDV